MLCVYNIFDEFTFIPLKSRLKRASYQGTARNKLIM